MSIILSRLQIYLVTSNALEDESSYLNANFLLLKPTLLKKIISRPFGLINWIESVFFFFLFHFQVLTTPKAV